MKRKADLTAATKAVQDLVIGEIPPEPGPELPFTMTKKVGAALAVRKRRLQADNNMKHELEPAPQINALSFAIRYLPGGRKTFLEFVKLAVMNGDPSAEAFWRVYGDLAKTHRDRCSFDDVCTAAGLKPNAFLPMLVGQAMDAQADSASLIAAALQPMVMQAAGKSAVRIDGEYASIAADDRRQILQASGAWPTPKPMGTSVHVNASANAQAAQALRDEPSVPKFASDMAALSGGNRRLLSDGTVPVFDVEVEAAEG